MHLSDLASHLDHLLRVSEIADYGPALNGLQVGQGDAPVTRVAAAVDAALPTIREAVEREADLLLVHHGLFWNGLQPVTGAQFEKMRLCIENGLAIYSAHLPLDVHPELGNNAQIAKAMDLDLENAGGFLDYKGSSVGITIEVETSLSEITEKFEEALGSPVHVCNGGPPITRRIGISSGGSGSEVAAAAKAGIDTFLTGEGPHWSYTLAEELGINVLYGGHYATETFGVKALAGYLEERFQLPWEFIDHPTGL
jgi:dinuclear metal center YbgI/SA1388 family protein